MNMIIVFIMYKYTYVYGSFVYFFGVTKAKFDFT